MQSEEQARLVIDGELEQLGWDYSGYEEIESHSLAWSCGA